jgi:hypothetical protein
MGPSSSISDGNAPPRIPSGKEPTRYEPGITKETQTTAGSGKDAGTKPLLVQQESGIRVPSKLQTTLGIILIALLIFITSLAGIFVFFLVLFTKRRRQIQRMVMTNNGKDEMDEPQSTINKKCSKPTKTTTKTIQSPQPTTRFSSSLLLVLPSSSSVEKEFADEKNDSTSFIHAPPLSIGSSSGYDEGGGDDDAFRESELSLQSSTTTIISSINDFPPPPTSIISTSTSHGYGSIEEEYEESQRE